MSRFFIDDRKASGTGPKFITHEHRLKQQKNEFKADIHAILNDDQFNRLILDYDHGIHNNHLIPFNYFKSNFNIFALNILLVT